MVLLLATLLGAFCELSIARPLKLAIGQRLLKGVVGLSFYYSWYLRQTLVLPPLLTVPLCLFNTNHLPTHYTHSLTPKWRYKN